MGQRPESPPQPGIAEDLLICDVTLREGEQAPGVVLSAQDRKAVLSMLEQSGVHQAQIGVLGRPDGTAASRAVIDELAGLASSAEGIAVEIMTHPAAANWKETVELAVECGADVVHGGFFVSSNVSSGWGPAKKSTVAERIDLFVDHAHSWGREANISLIDASRADRADVVDLVSAAARAGAERVRIPDTTGSWTPEEIYRTVSECVEAAGGSATRIGVHCHNDFGLALANTLAGLKAGARLADVSVNGLGDRCGNTVLAELVAVLEVLEGHGTGMDLSTMTSLSRQVEQLTASNVSSTAPIVGEFAFSHEIDVHIAELLRNPLAFQRIRSEAVGNETRILFGTKSGEASLQYMERQHGMIVDDALRSTLLAHLAEMDRARPGEVLGEADFWAALHRVEDSAASSPRRGSDQS